MVGPHVSRGFGWAGYVSDRYRAAMVYEPEWSWGIGVQIFIQQTWFQDAHVRVMKMPSGELLAQRTVTFKERWSGKYDAIVEDLVAQTLLCRSLWATAQFGGPTFVTTRLWSQAILKHAGVKLPVTQI